MIRPRTVRMADELWEAINTLAQRNERPIAEEIRLGMEAWVKLAGNITVEGRKVRSYARNENLRQRGAMKKKEEK